MNLATKVSSAIENSNIPLARELIIKNWKSHPSQSDLLGSINEIAKIQTKNMELDGSLELINIGNSIIDKLSEQEFKEKISEITQLNSQHCQVHYFKGDLDSYYELSKSTLGKIEKFNYKLGQAVMESNIGVYYWQKGKNELALQHLENSVILANDSGDKKRIAISINNRGIMFQANDRLEEAIQDHREAMKVQKEIEDFDGLPPTINSLGFVLFRTGEYHEALELFHEAVEIATKNNDKKNLSNYFGNIGAIHHHRGEIDMAADNYHHQLEINLELQNEGEIARTYLNLGEIEIGKGNLEKAEELLNQAAEIQSRLKLNNDLIQTLLVLYETAIQDQKTGENYYLQIEQLAETPENEMTTQIYIYAQALSEKQKMRGSSNAKSKELFYEIIKQPLTYYYELKVQTVLHVCELLIIEYKGFENPEIIDELNRLLDELESDAFEQHLYLLYVETILLRIKLATLLFEFENIKGYFETIEDFIADKDLGVFANIVQEEKWKFIRQTQKMKQITVDYNDHEAKYAIVDVETYLRTIISKSYEYKNKISGFHFEKQDSTYCGINLKQLRDDEKVYDLKSDLRTKCSSCTSEFSKTVLKDIIRVHITDKKCRTCGNAPSVVDANNLILEYEKENPETTFDSFLGIQTPFRDGIISWKCYRSSCKNEELFVLDLQTVSEL